MTFIYKIASLSGLVRLTTPHPHIAVWPADWPDECRPIGRRRCVVPVDHAFERRLALHDEELWGRFEKWDPSARKALQKGFW